MKTHDLRFIRGTTYSEVYQYLEDDDAPINLTGYTATMQIRDPKTGELLLDVDGLPGALTITPLTGEVWLTLPAASSLPLPANTVMAYDLNVTSGGGQVTCLVSGHVILSKEVTQ